MTIDLSLLIIVLLALSLSLNVLLIWFLRGLASRLILVSENMSDLVDHLVRYGSNLKSVYEMELYYGDETIQGLVKHTQMILEILSDFELDGDNETESPQEAPAPQVQRKAVFYSGS